MSAQIHRLALGIPIASVERAQSLWSTAELGLDEMRSETSHVKVPIGYRTRARVAG
jgi:hypothetical protein